MSNTYFRVRLRFVPSVLEDDMTTLCFHHGALGVTEALAYTQPNLTYDARAVPVKHRELDVFFQETPPAEFYLGVNELDRNIQAETHEEENRDWLAEWKKGFKPFKLVGPYWVVPSWEEPPAECGVPLRIDPGMAFGTGTHATTQMMAAFIHQVAVKHGDKLKDWTLLDVGTGTAILAMLARKAGFGLVTGLEIDPEARRTARENLKINGLTEIEVPETQIEETRSSFDVVVANIIDGVLIDLRKELLRVSQPGGFLMVTGILKERDDEFFAAFVETSPVKVLRRLEKDEWVGYWLQVAPA